MGAYLQFKRVGLGLVMLVTDKQVKNIPPAAALGTRALMQEKEKRCASMLLGSAYRQIKCQQLNISGKPD